MISGYATAAAFVGLVVLAELTHAIPFQRVFLSLVAFKIVTNTFQWLALRTNRFVLPASGINIVGDLVTMTGAIYFTGGLLSPLFPIYAIEITVFALLTNVGLTVSVAVSCVVLYAAMAIATYAGWIPSFPPPVTRAEDIRLGHIVVNLAFAVFVLGVPTYYAAKILQELREKTRDLEENARALVEAGRLKSQFMANVTHELRTPIHGICGLTDLVESGVYGDVTEKQRDAQQSIKRSARSLLGLIDDLLELARSDAGKLALKPEKVCLTELLPTVIASARWMIGMRQLTLDTAIDDDLPAVNTDPRKLNQILINLLSNAVKFTEDGGRLVIRARRKGDAHVVIEVEDTGLGIAPEDVTKIFEEFRQLDAAQKGAYGGMGIGLSLVKRLSDAMHAEIDVSSVVGKGSTFAVTLPIEWQ